MFKINDIEKFSSSMVEIVFEKIKKKISEMLNENEDKLNAYEFVKLEEVVIISKYIICRYNNNNYEQVPDKIAYLVCEDLSHRFYSNCLNKMVNSQFLDCAFSEKDDAFVFQLTEKGEKSGMKIISNVG